MLCPRCGTMMQGGICPECGFPVNRAKKKAASKGKHPMIKKEAFGE